MTAAVAQRPFTGQQQKIAELIVTVVVEAGERRGMSYSEIGAELGISPHTVRSYVRAMANGISGLDVLPPRTRILVAVKFPELAAALRDELAS